MNTCIKIALSWIMLSRTIMLLRFWYITMTNKAPVLKQIHTAYICPYILYSICNHRILMKKVKYQEAQHTLSALHTVCIERQFVTNWLASNFHGQPVSANTNCLTLTIQEIGKGAQSLWNGEMQFCKATVNGIIRYFDISPQ